MTVAAAAAVEVHFAPNLRLRLSMCSSTSRYRTRALWAVTCPACRWALWQWQRMPIRRLLRFYRHPDRMHVRPMLRAALALGLIGRDGPRRHKRYEYRPSFRHEALK